MNNFFIKFLVVALVCTNATLVFAQNNKLDSVLNRIEGKMRKGQYILAQRSIDSLRTLEIYQTYPTIFEVDLIHSNLLQSQMKDQEALNILLKGLQFSESEKFDNYASEFSFEIGLSFAKVPKNFEKAFEYYRKSKVFSERINDSLNLSKANLGIGNVHLKIYQRYKRGLKTMDSLAMDMHRDSVMYYHEMSLLTFPILEDDREFLGLINRSIMIFHFYENSYELSELYGKRSLEIFRELKDTINVSKTLNVFGAIKLFLLDYKEAENYYLEGNKLLNNKKSFKAIELRKRFLTNLADLYNQTKEFEKAYNYRSRAQYLQDSIYIQSTDVLIAESELVYNYSEKEKIAERETNRRKRTELWLYILGVVSILVFSLLWAVSRSNRLKREKKLLVLEQETLIKERAIEKVQNEAQIKILNATIDGKETERRHIAEILHNSVSALLSSAGLHLQAAKIALKEKAPEEIEKTQDIVAEAGEKIRDLSHTLISSVLLKFGLGYAMDDLCEKYSNSKLTFESDALDVERFNNEFEIKIHSIIEELINNILKHSNASQANILLKQRDGKLEIRIFDDGTGFDVAKMKKKKKIGLGLTQIEARIKMMDGVFDIKSAKETGTRIYINVPVPN